MKRFNAITVFIVSFVFCFLVSAGATSIGTIEASFAVDHDHQTIDDEDNESHEGTARRVLFVPDEHTDEDDQSEIKITRVFYINMLINLVAMALLIMLVYYPGNRKPDQVFTFIMFNIIIFMITYVLNQVKFSLGAAFGLFAVFTMLRYRTRTITMKDMTYLFIFIALGLINAVQLRYDVMVVINAFVILITWIMDSNLIFKQESSKTIQYDDIEMIKPENHEALIQDLRKRTGLQITRFEIRQVNFLRDTVRLTVYFRERPGGIYSRIVNGTKDLDEDMEV